MKNSPALYNADYYEDGINSGKSCYVNYRWLPDLTIPMVQRMIDYLGIRAEESVLDFGCAKGYTVKAFRQLGIAAYGVDVSSYAIANAPIDIKGFVRKIASGENIPLLGRGKTYDWFIVKDTLEHVAEQDMHKQLVCLAEACKIGLVIVPLGDGKKYIVPDYEKDVTHITCKPMRWWVDALEEAGFAIGRACYRVFGIKDNWSKWPKGNGFIEVQVK